MKAPHSHGDAFLIVHQRRVKGLRSATTLPAIDPGKELVATEATHFRAVDQETENALDGAFKRYNPSAPVKAVPTREAWLENCVNEFHKRVFSPVGHPLPPVKVAIGFPSAKGVSKKRRTLGQCWSREASDDGLNQIFLNPTLASAEQIVDVLAHELVHAVDDCKSGHKGAFWKICKAVGLTVGTPATASAGPSLKVTIEEICRDLGPLPHATLHAIDQEKKQSTRLLKVECPACGYTCRIAAKWIGYGLPICPCTSRMAAT